MYCSTCECEYDGWTGNCPNCKNALEDGGPPPSRIHDETIAYETLVQIIKDHGGRLDIDLTTIEVSKTKSIRFPYLGYGFAWTKRMEGSREGIVVDLITSEVGKDRKWAFPYQGHGFAWRQELQGKIAGNMATLTAKKVTRKKSWSFPFKGYGYAWTEEMTGDCGQDIKIKLTTTQVGKNRRWQFPYFGYGYAWVNEGILSMSLN